MCVSAYVLRTGVWDLSVDFCCGGHCGLNVQINLKNLCFVF